MPDEPFVSELFDPGAWRAVEGFELTDVTYHRALAHGTVRVAINRPEVRNAFRPRTVDELYLALDHARQLPDVGCVLLTGNGPSPKDGGWAFSSGGDQRVRGPAGYEYENEGAGAEPGGSESPLSLSPRAAPPTAGASGSAQRARLGRLHILQVQQLIRFMPKVVIAVVPGWAVGGGHSLHVVCDLTLASAEHARFRQTDADVASFDGGFGSAYLARQVGQKRAAEMFFVGRTYDAEEAYRMGMVNAVVPARPSRGSGPGMGGGHQRQEPHVGEHAQVRLQPGRRRAGRPAAVRRRSDAAGLHDRGGGRGPRRLPGPPPAGLVEFPLVLLRLFHRGADGAGRPRLFSTAGRCV